MFNRIPLLIYSFFISGLALADIEFVNKVTSDPIVIGIAKIEVGTSG